MKRILALLAIAAATATPAAAADLIEYIPPPPVVVAPPVWTGLYLGGQLGGSFNGGGSNPLSNAFIRIPAIPATPGTPAVPADPGFPGTPAIPGTPPVTIAPSIVEFSFACAGAGPAATCAGAIITNGVATPAALTRAELSAAIAAVGGNPADAAAAAVAVQVSSPGGTIPGTPGTPALPPVAPTPGSPAVPATPGAPEQIINVADLPGVTRFQRDSDGFIGGVHVGYDAQFGTTFGTGALVLGVVADLSYVDIERTSGFAAFGEVLSVREELDYLATVRGRAGLAYERTLVYATGGLAFGDVETTFVATPFNDVSSSSDTRVGYAVGGGVDFLLTDAFSLGVEYLYTDLGDDGSTRRYDIGGGSALEVNANEDFDFHTVWAKASFRFN